MNSAFSLLNGDCLELMADLPDGSFDAVITSPPYNKGRSTGGGSSKNWGIWRGGLSDRYASYRDDRPEADYEAWQAEVLRESWRLLSDRGAIFYNHKPRIQRRSLRTPLDWNPGLPVRQILTWVPGGGVNFSPTHYRGVAEWIVIFAKPGFRLRSRSHSGCGDVWRLPYDRGIDHPAPFPVSLPARILETAPIDRVIDPFMGSGTTGVACVQAGVPFVGIEIDPGYVAVAERRLAEAPRAA